MPEKLSYSKNEIRPEPELTAGQKKIQEYISRIKNGESKAEILKGLPASFVEGINAGLIDQEEHQKHALHIKEEEKQRLTEVRNHLGLENENKDGYQQVRELIDIVIQGRRKEVVELYERLYADIDNPASKKILLNALFGDVYNRYRKAEYALDPDEEKTWQKYIGTSNIPFKVENGWMYRGLFPQKGMETVTRGSFNVNINPKLIDDLDSLIESGKLKANYKFGEPGTSGSSTERHDSITIYFLEEPSQEVLQELSDVVRPHVRGNNLLGKKVSEGFYMSEVGSISTTHIEDAIAKYKDTYPELIDAIKAYTTPRPGSGTSLKMSEAQYYAIKDVAEKFGYTFSYDAQLGFTITQ